MPTISDLIEVFAARAENGGDPATVLDRARADGARRTPTTGWVAVGVSTAVVAAAAVTVGLVAPNLASHSTHRTGGSGPSPLGVSQALASTTGSLVGQASTVPITPQVAVQTLIDLLPRPGQTSDLSGGFSLGLVSGDFVYNDGDGAAEVSVSVSFPFVSPNPDPRYYGKVQRVAAGSLCSSPGVVQLGQPCTTLQDGSQLASYQGDANIPGGAKDWEVSLLRPDGVEVDVTEFNSPVEKGGAQTRANPPFTIAELSSIARSGQWQATTSSATAQAAAKLFRPEAR